MKTKIFLFLIIILSFYNCEKKEIPTVSTQSLSDSTITSITTGGKIQSDGGSKIISKGICYGTTPDITINNTYSGVLKRKDSINSVLKSLKNSIPIDYKIVGNSIFISDQTKK